ncbi:Hypothetical protein SLIV_10862 [Streptomyces lividans TK24]|uniref:Uncharacterized protein n=1 Tax=Streptomyces lividans TK24 TaxID=457428 RepID=A0ABX6TQL1_STRLI|nr:Hypothetical protein SLIV_10862 [Streptomyces lividans TK24]QSJ08687.1 Hypothetical protein SLIVDG2_10862 [Streptomyces lividans]QTD69611.1 Hypothetical protein SLIVYQS_10862 [Streptomyces lividans TK24] [Streptomyces lividans]
MLSFAMIIGSRRAGPQ